VLFCLLIAVVLLERPLTTPNFVLSSHCVKWSGLVSYAAVMFNNLTIPVLRSLLPQAPLPDPVSTVTLYNNVTATQGQPFVQNLYSNMMLKNLTGDSSVRISVAVNPFQWTAQQVHSRFNCVLGAFL
jgi:hypothetical protein